MEARYADLSRKTGMVKQKARLRTVGFGKSVSQKAVWAEKKVAIKANKYYNLGSTGLNKKAYLNNLELHEYLDSKDIIFICQIDSDEFLVEAGKPIIQRLRLHAVYNMLTKPDRKDMNKKAAQ